MLTLISLRAQIESPAFHLVCDVYAVFAMCMRCCATVTKIWVMQAHPVSLHPAFLTTAAQNQQSNILTIAYIQSFVKTDFERVAGRTLPSEVLMYLRLSLLHESLFRILSAFPTSPVKLALPGLFWSSAKALQGLFVLGLALFLGDKPEAESVAATRICSVCFIGKEQQYAEYRWYLTEKGTIVPLPEDTDEETVKALKAKGKLLRTPPIRTVNRFDDLHWKTTLAQVRKMYLQPKKGAGIGDADKLLHNRLGMSSPVLPAWGRLKPGQRPAFIVNVDNLHIFLSNGLFQRLINNFEQKLVKLFGENVTNSIAATHRWATIQALMSMDGCAEQIIHCDCDPLQVAARNLDGDPTLSLSIVVCCEDRGQLNVVPGQFGQHVVYTDAEGDFHGRDASIEVVTIKMSRGDFVIFRQVSLRLAGSYVHS